MFEWSWILSKKAIPFPVLPAERVWQPIFDKNLGDQQLGGTVDNSPCKGCRIIHNLPEIDLN
ncbi:hypothetical protein MUK70_08020 [Dyadobacter chenwenxiniae]|uniref:Uncharacterized protein n=1 Tax=Dyadobacter chenwenxiniae TaxID=2906456 RepID=A0A9X1PKA7_9BACT|nr:hypothetical protein [Dyadobacter chenwenxiniae]MCF0062897.1 hypothetical protein [Dyadobacter chenwenxiniae]UON84928.1 hypothetical protein MUK70_08020 [Dyadobacter chenwenxiniae]